MKRKIIFLLFGVIFSVLLLSNPDSPAYSATNPIPWNNWVKQLRSQAISQGVRPDVFDSAFKSIKAPSRQVLRYDRTQSFPNKFWRHL